MYYNGEYVLKSYKKAFEWYKKSAEQGDASAQFNIGIMYYYGDGITLDEKKSAYWMKKAYENGSEKAKKFWEDEELWKYE